MPSQVEVKSSDFAKRNEKDFCQFKNNIQESRCRGTLVLQSNCPNYTALSDLKKNGCKRGQLTYF